MPAQAAHSWNGKKAEPSFVDVQPLKKVHRAACYDYRLVERRLGGRVKRAADLVIAAAALAFLAPLLVLVALLIRLESAGPILFTQRRTGFRGRAFNIYKFRTMRADEGGDLRQARPDDSRVSRLGAVLRKLSIDELPQLLNVMRGDMSIVGPRPHALAHDDWFADVSGAYPHRFIARPGITGLAQVSGARGLTDTPEKVRERLRYDLAYVDNWSLFGDIKIIAKTCLLLFGDRHAY